MSTAEQESGTFTLTPTPDDGTRLGEQLPWDESDRPTAHPARHVVTSQAVGSSSAAGEAAGAR
jgi:hypothetical protein